MVVTRNAKHEEKPVRGLTPLATPRVWGLVARDAPVCAILRRGPSRFWQLLRWETETSLVEPGQWVRAEIAPLVMDISPNGDKVGYFCSKRSAPDPRRQHWTAISRLPFFSALALWFHPEQRAGGLLFESDETVLLNSSNEEMSELYVEDPTKPCPAQVKPKLDGGVGTYPTRLERDGWRCTHKTYPTTFEKSVGEATLRCVYPWRPTYELSISGDSPVRVKGMNWGEFDQRGRVLAAIDGKLCIGSARQFRDQDYFIVSDLTEFGPEFFEAPDWATEWSAPRGQVR